MDRKGWIAAVTMGVALAVGVPVGAAATSGSSTPASPQATADAATMPRHCQQQMSSHPDGRMPMMGG